MKNRVPGAHCWTIVFARIFLFVALIGQARADYSALVNSDGPVAYYRFNDADQLSTINKNAGSLGVSGDATNDLAGLHGFPGSIVGALSRSAFFDGTCRTEIPWNANLNPSGTQPFTLEGWIYPGSDQISGGPCVIDNRYGWAGENWQGWALFQRKSNNGYAGSESVGWNFRMYNGGGSNVALEVSSLVPYELGKWMHLAVVYEPLQVSNARLIIYVNGIAVNTNSWSGSGNGYLPNRDGQLHPPACLALGNCNNTAGTNLNAYFGALDEIAFYTNALSAEQLFSHYQNGTNANRTLAYQALIQSASPALYLRLDEIPTGPDVALNLGVLRSAGNGSHTAEVRHPATSALTGRIDDGSAAYHNRNGASITTIPWAAENNPDAGIPFTMEVWLKPLRDLQGGQTALNNRYVSSGNRTGWVLYQRNPNLAYPPSEGHGWNFGMYYGYGSGRQDVYTGTDYDIGEWSHLVITWEPMFDYGDYYENGNHQFLGVLTAYFNGRAVGTNANVLYAANTFPTEDATAPADLAIGAYNAASGLGVNPFEGGIDEFAFYNNYVLTPAQILEHYVAGTNTNYGTNYETLVLTAPFSGVEGQGPKTYLRFNDPGRSLAVNRGTAGALADANLILATNSATGPQGLAYPGFGPTNPAVSLSGFKQWASLNNPDALNVSGQITLEAWIKPSATQGTVARIISHGPPILSDFLAAPPPGAVTNGCEVFLYVDGAGSNYVVGSSAFTNAVGTNTYSATFPIPPGDLGGGSWIYLAGTYDGAAWRLFRNGTQVALAPSSVGALPVPNGDWAIASAGAGWTDAFAGSIDEVAIYNHALSPAKIAAHYNAAIAIPIITIGRSGNSVVLTWPYGTLYQADSVTGPWTPVPENPSFTYTVTAREARKFYRF